MENPLLRDVEVLRNYGRLLIRELGFFKRSFGEMDLTQAQAHILYEVNRGVEVTQEVVARLLNIDQSTASRNLKVLISKKLIKTNPDPNDRRKKILQLTRLGKTELNHYENQSRVDILAAFDFLSEDERSRCIEGMNLYALSLVKANIKKGDSRRLAAKVYRGEQCAMDVEGICRFINDIYQIAEAGIWKEGFQRTSKQELHEFLATGEIEVVELDTTVVGTIGRFFSGNDAVEFELLAVDPMYRGLGIGEMLIDSTEKWAASSGRSCVLFKLLTPKNWKHQDKAFLKDWYKNLGYREQKKLKFEEYHPGLIPMVATPYNFHLWSKLVA